MCLAKIRGFLLEPSKAFSKEAKTPVSGAVTYVMILGVVSAILLGVVGGDLLAYTLATVFPALEGAPSLLAVIVIMYLAAVGGTLAGGIFLHVFAYLFGARKGIGQTVKAVAYASTPSLLLGWIPFAGIIFWIWSLALEVIGLHRLHGISTERALGAVLLPIVIFTILVLTVMALFAVLFLSTFWPMAT